MSKYFGPIREARKLFFSESISKCQVTVELNEVGWIHVRQFRGNGGLFGLTPKFAQLSLTVDDARNLVKCLSEFIPPSEGDEKKEVL
jgi:hypothetical protein